MGSKGTMGPKGSQTGLRLELKIQSDLISAQNFDVNPMSRVPDPRNRENNSLKHNNYIEFDVWGLGVGVQGS